MVEAAIGLASTSHFEDVSMRALALDLGVPVMTLYSYVPNREALNELISNHVLRDVSVPGPDAGSWEERLRQLERDARRAMTQYPGLKFNQRGGVPSEASRLIAGVLSILEDGGFTPDQASRAFAALFTFMIGQIEVDAYDESATLAATMESGTQSTPLSREEAFEFALSAVIEGLKVLLSVE